MSRTIREVMSRELVVLSPETSLTKAAQMMRDHDIGDVIISEDGRVSGILTDRDMVIRAIADGRDPSDTTIGEICTRDTLWVTPAHPVDEAVGVMREQAVRRLIVLDDDRPVGIVSLGDIAEEREPASALGSISAAPPQH